MDKISKFISDIDRVKKFERAQNPAGYDGEKACLKIKDLFSKSNSHVSTLADSFADYWLDTYIRNSPDIRNEPTQQNVDIIAAMQALLDLEQDPEFTKALSKSDWKELCSLTNMEGDDLPLEFLNDIMMMFVDHQAL